MGKRNRRRNRSISRSPPRRRDRDRDRHDDKNDRERSTHNHRHSLNPNTLPQRHHHHHHHNQSPSSSTIIKRPTFASYLDSSSSNLTPKVKLLCEIISTTASASVEKVLDDTGLRVIQDDVEDVLKLSYEFPGSAVKFFRWSGFQLNDKHSPYGWNLVVDMLGKNSLFDAMWDAIKSMRKEGLLSLATFASVFSSYVAVNRVEEAIMTFEVMEQYGVPRDIVALNSLISAICRDGKVVDAVDFMRTVRDKIKPDADTYAILLEGWENEGDVAGARVTFNNMVIDIGWDPDNVPAYESYLSTVIKSRDGIKEALKVFELMSERRCYPGMKFFRAAISECVKTGDGPGARLVWDAMVGKAGCRPDTELYNSMVVLYCYHRNADFAKKLLDEMVFVGAFPDEQTYNLLLQFLVKSKKVSDASSIFNEMVKNECIPSESNCEAAIKVHIDTGSSSMAIKIWRCMIGNYNTDLEQIGNYLLVGLRDSNRLPEAIKCAEDMIDRSIKVHSSTLAKLKQSLTKAGKLTVYDELLRKLKAH